MNSEHELTQPDGTTHSDQTGASLSRKGFIEVAGVAAAGTLAATSGIGRVAAHAAQAPGRAGSSATQTVVQATGLDVAPTAPQYFKSIPGYYAGCNLYDIIVA